MNQIKNLAITLLFGFLITYSNQSHNLFSENSITNIVYSKNKEFQLNFSVFEPILANCFSKKELFKNKSILKLRKSSFQISIFA